MSRTAGPARAVCSGIVRFPFFYRICAAVGNSRWYKAAKETEGLGWFTHAIAPRSRHKRQQHKTATFKNYFSTPPLSVSDPLQWNSTLVSWSLTTVSTSRDWDSQFILFNTLNRSRWSSVAILFKVWRQRLFLVRSSSIDLCFFFSF